MLLPDLAAFVCFLSAKNSAIIFEVSLAQIVLHSVLEDYVQTNQLLANSETTTAEWY